jgi:hypothetical protein
VDSPHKDSNCSRQPSRIGVSLPRAKENRRNDSSGRWRNCSSALLIFPALILLSAFAAGTLTLTLLLILLIARLGLFLSLLGPLLGSLLVFPLSLVLLILIFILIAHGHSSFAIVSQQMGCRAWRRWMCANPHKSSDCSAGIVELLKSDSCIRGLAKTQLLMRIGAGLGDGRLFWEAFL